MKHPKIFLIGMPGSGKSTLGKKLSEELKLPFIDLDEEIEKAVGMSIPELFKQDGEDHFRELERKQLHVEIEKPTFLMATGGGTPCFFDNMEVMNGVGLTVFLDVPVEELEKRLSGNQDRPLLAGVDDLKEVIQGNREERLAFYERAKQSTKQASTEELIRLFR